VKHYIQNFQNSPIQDPIRKTVQFASPENRTIVYRVEELVAAQLDHAHRIAKRHTKDPILGAVITVPPYFNQFERQAMLDAAKIAGLTVYSLVNDGTAGKLQSAFSEEFPSFHSTLNSAYSFTLPINFAVAINYATNRMKDITATPSYHIIFDMGAGSTVATVFSLAKVSQIEKGRNVTSPTLQVHAVGSDRFIGGQDIDKVIQHIIVQKFKDTMGSRFTKTVEENESAMTKFHLQAVRVKEAMSKVQTIVIHVMVLIPLPLHPTLISAFLQIQ
jgi:hypoxia up-regulated 1